MNVFLWILAGVLAALFLGAGATKLTQPRSKLQSNMGWVEDYSDTGVKLIGAVEILGAIGLILPAVLDIAPILVPLAATGLAIIMAGAIITHVRRKELPLAGFNVVLLVLTVVVAIFRFGPNSF
jgi:uncharacterized membrane protein YphA (DoxX/SURF4 family)